MRTLSRLALVGIASLMLVAAASLSTRRVSPATAFSRANRVISFTILRARRGSSGLAIRGRPWVPVPKSAEVTTIWVGTATPIRPRTTMRR